LSSTTDWRIQETRPTRLNIFLQNYFSRFLQYLDTHTALPSERCVGRVTAKTVIETVSRSTDDPCRRKQLYATFLYPEWSYNLNNVYPISTSDSGAASYLRLAPRPTGYILTSCDSGSISPISISSCKLSFACAHRLFDPGLKLPSQNGICRRIFVLKKEKEGW